jgi:hypothetical protein
VVPSEDYSHGPPSLRGLFCEGRKTEAERQSTKKNTMNTTANTKNIMEGALSRSECASTEKNHTPALPGMETLVAPFRFKPTPYEYKVTALRECPTPESLLLCDTPERAAEYWRLHVQQNPFFKKEKADYIAQCSG